MCGARGIQASELCASVLKFRALVVSVSLNVKRPSIAICIQCTGGRAKGVTGDKRVDAKGIQASELCVSDL